MTIDCGRHLGAVIGKAGAIIQSLQTETGARIDADRSTSSVKLVGSTEQVAAAAEKIRAIVHGEASQLIPLGERGSRVLLADGGAGIKKLSAQFDGVRLELDRDKRALRATGTAAQVAAVSEATLELLDEHSHSVRVELGHQAGAVIGRGGVHLRSVQETSGAVLRIDRDALLESNLLVITGTEAQVSMASGLVHKLLRAELEPELEPGETLAHVDVAGAVAPIIGKGGANLQRLSSESGAKVVVPRGTTTCVISGPPEAVEKAKATIEDLIAKFRKAASDAEAAGAELADGEFAGDNATEDSGTNGKSQSAAAGGWDMPADSASASTWGAPPPTTGWA